MSFFIVFLQWWVFHVGPSQKLANTQWAMAWQYFWSTLSAVRFDGIFAVIFWLASVSFIKCNPFMQQASWHTVLTHADSIHYPLEMGLDNPGKKNWHVDVFHFLSCLRWALRSTDLMLLESKIGNVILFLDFKHRKKNSHVDVFQFLSCLQCRIHRKVHKGPLFWTFSHLLTGICCAGSSTSLSLDCFNCQWLWS